MAVAFGSGSASDVRPVLGAVSCVLFDFDGPVCAVYGGRPAAGVTHELRRFARMVGVPDSLLGGSRNDPLAVLRSCSAAGLGEHLLEAMHRYLTRLETRAVEVAPPTRGAGELIGVLRRERYELAVVTNNSALCVERYLAVHGLRGSFAAVHGRTRDPDLLKPHPDSVRRALVSLGVAPRDALFLGDSPADVHAARAAGVPFLGYARNDRKLRALRESGAHLVVESLDVVTDALATK
ncbi:HAD family hydrolase [Streptomyces sp. NPDC048211]|uniref:HAD family hydrolase n=1 Tax=Streptomyces sp. NPDC048211 TaxID=3365516 RepID=UPI0037170D09